MMNASGDEFRFTETALAYLLSPEGYALLADLAKAQVDKTTILHLTTQLRKTLPPDIVAAALDVALLRQKARKKFARADAMFFTREALEQASAEIISRYRAQRFARYPTIADLCCGIGGDTLALAAHTDVLAVDTDPNRLRLSVANARVYGVSDRLRTVCGDVTGISLPSDLPFWADPSRRIGGRRVFSLQAYQPPLSALLRLAERAPAAGIKLSPGVNYDELATLIGTTPYEVEIISVRGQGREAVLWLGDLRTANRRATLLPGPHTLTDRPLPEPVSTTHPRRYLYEPDPAVIRAHLVEHLAQDLGFTKIDDQIAYLTADTLVRTPFATAYRVEETMPFNLKRLNRRLRELHIGELIIKKRGLPVDPEQFRRRLKYGGGKQRVVLVLTRVQDRPTALICHPVN
jgi:SAM-dependent methyltransferase